MLRSFLAAPLLVLGLASTALARSATGDRVLVVLEPQAEKAAYSKLWASLECDGAPFHARQNAHEQLAASILPSRVHEMTAPSWSSLASRNMTI